MIAPNDDEQAQFDRITFDELVRRDLGQDSKAAHLHIIDGLRDRDAGGVILGCTETFLLVSQKDRPDFPMLNTTALHVERAVATAFGNDGAEASAAVLFR